MIISDFVLVFHSSSLYGFLSAEEFLRSNSPHYGVITLSENETDNDSNNKNYNYRCHSDVQKCSHCSETLLRMALATFILSVSFFLFFGLVFPQLAKCVLLILLQ